MTIISQTHNLLSAPISWQVLNFVGRCDAFDVLDWMQYFWSNSTQNVTVAGLLGGWEQGVVKTSNNPRGNENGYTLVSGGWLDVSENAIGIEIKHKQEGEAVLYRILQITL